MIGLEGLQMQNNQPSKLKCHSRRQRVGEHAGEYSIMMGPAIGQRSALIHKLCLIRNFHEELLTVNVTEEKEAEIGRAHV